MAHQPDIQPMCERKPGDHGLRFACQPSGACIDDARQRRSALPNSAHATASTGTINVAWGKLKIRGNSTAWSPALEGMALQVRYPVGGCIRLTRNSRSVLGSNTHWIKALRNELLFLPDDPTPYRIHSVDRPDQLTLDRPYCGPDIASKNYSIAQSDLYLIRSIESPLVLRLDRPYRRMSHPSMLYRIGAPFFDRGQEHLLADRASHA